MLFNEKGITYVHIIWRALETFHQHFITEQKREKFYRRRFCNINYIMKRHGTRAACGAGRERVAHRGCRDALFCAFRVPRDLRPRTSFQLTGSFISGLDTIVKTAI